MKFWLLWLSYCNLIISLSMSSAFGWGKEGHRIVADIATSYLTEEAKAEIIKLIGHDQIADVAYFADEFKQTKAGAYTEPWHYANIDKGKSYFDSPKNPNGDLLKAILLMEKDLSNQSLNKEKRTFALKIYVHLMADLHQPLHLGLKKDRGGNDIAVKWMGKKTNLHKLWDSNLIQSDAMSFSEKAKIYKAKMAHLNVSDWQKGDFFSWANESVQQSFSVYKSGMGSLGYEYKLLNQDLLDNNLMKAGFRLAKTLNELFKYAPVTKIKLDWYKKLKIME